MSYLPSTDVDFSKMTVEERSSLTTHLKHELAKTVARKLHIEQLLDKLNNNC